MRKTFELLRSALISNTSERPNQRYESFHPRPARPRPRPCPSRRGEVRYSVSGLSRHERRRESPYGGQKAFNGLSDL